MADISLNISWSRAKQQLSALSIIQFVSEITHIIFTGSLLFWFGAELQITEVAKFVTKIILTGVWGRVMTGCTKDEQEEMQVIVPVLIAIGGNFRQTYVND